MSIKNNQIYLTAMQFVEDFPKGYPETFLCGIAELLMMDEGKVRLILGSDKIAELESVRRVFESFNLDPKLVRQGLRLCIPYLPDTDQTKEQRTAFQSDVESETLGYSMAQMVRTALSRCYVPVLDIYVKSSSYQKASNYYFQLKKLHAGSAKPDTGKQDGKKADDKKPDEEKAYDKGDARIGDKTGTKKTPSSPGRRPIPWASIPTPSGTSRTPSASLSGTTGTSLTGPCSAATSWTSATCTWGTSSPARCATW